MSKNVNKRKAADDGPRARKRSQMVMAPKGSVQPILSDTSTIPFDLTHEMGLDLDTEGVNTTAFDVGDLGPALSDEDDKDSLDGDDDDEYPHKTTDPMRSDMPIKRTRWEKEETDALMTALNVNRDAIKFHFDGPGGGRDVKRQAWRDVATYVNDVANTHRTVDQCRNKTDDYTQRVKGKYNKLRHAVSQTGRGTIKNGLKLKDTENKALDYLREEAVRGIPGISAMSLGGPKSEKPSRKNRALLWEPERKTKPKYEEVDMKKEGVPKYYKEKNNRRVAREMRLKRKIEHKKIMIKERSQERKDAKVIKEAKKKEKQMEVDQQKKQKKKEALQKEKLAEKNSRRMERAAKRKATEQRRQEKERKKKAERKRERAARRERKEARRLKRQERKNREKTQNKKEEKDRLKGKKKSVTSKGKSKELKV